jgi:hypothetical protein
VRRLRPLLAVATLLLPACRGTAIDGSTPDAAKASIEQIERELAPEDRRQFEGAIRFVVADSLAAHLAFGSGSTADEVNRRVTGLLDGKTAPEVIALAEAIRAERAAPEPASP